MPFNFTDDAATADGTSTAEDAMPLLEFLQSHADARVDLGPCNQLHTAVLQVLMAARPTIVAMPQEAFLARWLPPALQQPNTLRQSNGAAAEHPGETAVTMQVS